MILYNNQKQKLLTLDTSKEINRGGEGAIYEHPSDKSLVIKVYHTTGSLSAIILQELMKLPDNFIKPLELYYDTKGALKGLSMKYLDTNKLILLSHVFNKGTAAKLGYTPPIKNKIYVNLCNGLVQAHRAGIVIGDFNPYNIFVNTSGEVFFIDVDSFQTHSKPHSGVMLPEIRDWLTHNIDQKTDYYALSVLVFQLFTHVHPYKGIHPKYKSLEERVVRHVSLLSGDKDLIIPAFYQPLDKLSNLEFHAIFQEDKRAIPQLSAWSGPVIAPQVILNTAVVYKEGDLTVKVLDTNVEEIDSIGVRFYTRKRRKYVIYYQLSPGIANEKTPPITGDDVILGKTNTVIAENNTLTYYSPILVTKITNFNPAVNSFAHKHNGKMIFFEPDTDTYSLLDTDKILNGKSIGFQKGTIFVKSIGVTNGIVQTIPSMKAILDISQGVLKTVRTNLNVTDIHLTPSGAFGCVSIKDNKGVKSHLCKIDGMKLELGPEVDGMCSIAEAGDYLYVPADKALHVHRKFDMGRIAVLPCKYIDEQSVLKHCNAGILCLTGDILYLMKKV